MENFNVRKLGHYQQFGNKLIANEIVDIMAGDMTKENASKEQLEEMQFQAIPRFNEVKEGP